MLLLYRILKWLNKLTDKCMIYINKKMELKKIYKIIKDNKEKYVEINGAKGYVILIEYGTENTHILQTIKQILLVAENNAINNKDTEQSENGFVIKEIKFDNYINKDDLYNVINNQIMEFNNKQITEETQLNDNIEEKLKQYPNMNMYKRKY